MRPPPLFLILFSLLFAACKKDETPEPSDATRTPDQAKVLHALFEPPVRDPSEGRDFVGAQSCKQCHQQSYEDWTKSHHHAAMMLATPDTVLADFETTFVHFGRETRFFRKGEEFWVNTENSDGERQDFQVTHTFGITPLQQYLIPFPGGRLQALNICWDSRPAEEGGQRWYHLYPDEEIPPDDVLHWTGRHFNWNYMCADCHSTNLAKNYDLETNTYNTTWSEMNVSCEACHGPGSQHVAWAEALSDPTKTVEEDPTGNMGLLVDLRKDGGAWAVNPETGKPKRTKPLENHNEVQTCAPCHSHRQPLQPKRLFGQELLDSYLPSVLDPVLYHGDGQIDEEVYVYGSFVQSKMYHSDVTCSDCHHPHTMQTYAQDNSLCSRCHTPALYDTPAHHFHPMGSTGASCVECHMPHKTYMGVDPRRDHSIRIPRPDLSKSFGTPNACNTCHVDQDATWATDAFHGWWGKKPRPHYSELLVKGHRDPQVWEKELVRLSSQSDAPGIARAAALDLLVENPSQIFMKTIEARLADPDPIVRHHAVSRLDFAGITPSERAKKGAPLLHDPIRAVRIEAARALADLDRRLFQLEDLKALDSATNEYIEAQQSVADVPEGHMTLALLYQKQNQPQKVEASYLNAIRIDPRFVPARINLAEFYFQSGRVNEAAPILEEGVNLQPNDGYAHEALGRFLIRTKQYGPGMERIARAVELLPERGDLRYFLGIGLNQTASYQEALPQLKKAVELEPSNVEYLMGLVAVSRDAADFVTAANYADRLVQLQPGNRQFLVLKEQMLQMSRQQ